ncbi:hypothetical protein Rsub_05888 [Raphidocelis subcapitata]|uniref:Uncharacterized protein n=1 Tax=Raphidocelis subcapitata TaxID=307507 RepID=A0A2V0P7J2_9CHLO|nr:hypothetical protein Rsub_05888 [Raphidocelis subcapitata]|eukprot:GBF93157.1 hypothetical protein Rsub_05888 [Raphidocelis subcapitata]
MKGLLQARASACGRMAPAAAPAYRLAPAIRRARPAAVAAAGRSPAQFDDLSVDCFQTDIGAWLATADGWGKQASAVTNGLSLLLRVIKEHQAVLILSVSDRLPRALAALRAAEELLSDACDAGAAPDVELALLRARRPGLPAPPPAALPQPPRMPRRKGPSLGAITAACGAVLSTIETLDELVKEVNDGSFSHEAKSTLQSVVKLPLDELAAARAAVKAAYLPYCTAGIARRAVEYNRVCARAVEVAAELDAREARAAAAVRAAELAAREAAAAAAAALQEADAAREADAREAAAALEAAAVLEAAAASCAVRPSSPPALLQPSSPPAALLQPPADPDTSMPLVPAHANVSAVPAPRPPCIPMPAAAPVPPLETSPLMPPQPPPALPRPVRRDVLRIAGAFAMAALASAALPPPPPPAIASHPLADIAAAEAGDAAALPTPHRGPLASAARLAFRALRLGPWGRRD